jgi:hypothetical protein
MIIPEQAKEEDDLIELSPALTPAHQSFGKYLE